MAPSASLRSITVRDHLKRLIIAFDGTGNRTETTSNREVTNVARIVRSIKPVAADGTTQNIEYVRGIGSGRLLDRFFGGATGEGISTNIEQGYHFIANNYSTGDDIFLLGFSRGAYTAMSLSGFLNHVGILRKRELHRFPDAYQLYRSTSIEDMRHIRSLYEQAQEGYSIPIRFLGLWDSVGHLTAVPLLTERNVKYHEVELAPNVSHAYHALAVHEIRGDFPATLWTHRGSATDIQQVWFPGCHSDVGGTYREDAGLSNLTLHWMVDHARPLRLEFDDELLGSMTPDDSGRIHRSLTASWEWRSANVRDIDSSNGVEQFVHPSVLARRGSNPGPKRAASYFAEAENRACALPMAPLTAAEEARDRKELADDKKAQTQARVDKRIKDLKEKHEPTKTVFKRRTDGGGNGT